MDTIISFRTKGLKVWRHAGFQKYFKNTGWMLFGKIFNMTISFFVVIFVVRYLGPEKYGVVSYVLGLATLFSVISRMGIDETILRDLVKIPEEKDLLLGSSLLIKFWSSILAITLGTTLMLLTEGFTEITLFVFVMFLSFLFRPAEIFRNYFQAEINGKIITIAEVISRVITAILLLSGVFRHASLLYFICIYSLDWALPFITLTILYGKNNKLTNLRYSKKSLVKIIKESAPLLFTSILTVVLAKTDIIMIRNFLDETQTGIYGAAVRLSEFWYVVPAVVITSFFPAIARSHKRNLSEYKRRTIYLSILILGMSIIVSLFFTFFSDYIIRVIFGDTFIAASSILSLYIWSSIGMSITLILKKDMLINNRTSQIFIFSLVTVILNFVLNFIFIPVYGINGAASATLISSAIFGILYFITTKLNNIIINLY